MKNTIQIGQEEKNLRDYLAWVDKGREILTAYISNNQQIPSLLGGISGNAKKNHDQTSHVPQPEKPASPINAASDWIWILAKDASVRTVVLAILSNGPTTSKELISKATKILGKKQNSGSIYNVIAVDKRIKKTADGICLQDNVQAPILYENYIWGTRESLQPQDIAETRRVAVRHLLRHNPDGLQLMQIYNRLKNVPWLDAPISKDLIKADLEVMDEKGLVKRRRMKWTLAKKEDS